MSDKPTSTDEYLATLGDGQRAIVEELRRTISAAVPQAEESFGYGMPGFQLGGKGLIWYAAWSKHYSLYPLTDAMLKSIPSGEAGYEISGKGTIRFPASAPVPHGLVAELVKARARELQEANN